DALLVTSPASWYYLTGFTGESGALIVTPDGATLLTDGRFTVQAREELRGVSVELQKDGLYESCGRLLRARRRRKVGFAPDQLTVAQLEALRRAAGGGVRFERAAGLVEALRARKSPPEIACMRRAAALADAVVREAIRLLKPGV